MSVAEKRAQAAVGHPCDSDDEQDFDQEERQESEIRRILAGSHSGSASYLKHLNNRSGHALLVADLQRHFWFRKKLYEKEEVAAWFVKH